MATDDGLKFPKSGLMLIGMGPGRISSMTIEAKQAAIAADYRRYEAYTALWPSNELKTLENEIGKIEMVMRPEVENPTELLELSKNNLVALLIVGDPLQATTHVDLQLQALEAGIDCIVFHGISITTLVTGSIGLSTLWSFSMFSIFERGKFFRFWSTKKIIMSIFFGNKFHHTFK